MTWTKEMQTYISAREETIMNALEILEENLKNEDPLVRGDSSYYLGKIYELAVGGAFRVLKGIKDPSYNDRMALKKLERHLGWDEKYLTKNKEGD